MGHIDSMKNTDGRCWFMEFTKMVDTKLDIQLRPKAASKRMGVAESTFWKLAKTDPDFPPLMRLGSRCTSVSSAALDSYVAKKTDCAR